MPKGGGAYHIGKPYEIAGSWYRPQEDSGYNRVGTASWYGELFHGRRTANGEIYDMDRLSAAHPTLPLPVYARVTNLANGRSIVVRVNDRGPFARNRIIDLSRRSAEVLGFRQHGTAPVRVTYLRRAPLNGDDSYERSHLASQPFMQVATKARARRKSEPRIVGLAEEQRATYGGSGTSRAAPAASPNPSVAGRSLPAGEKPNGGQSAGMQVSVQPKVDHEPTGAVGKIGRSGGLEIQAGSFRNKENADRARSVLGAIAPVNVAEVEVGAQVYYRVRVGPFPDRPGAEAALNRITRAGYQGAKVVAAN